MSTAYPAGIDNFTNPNGTASLGAQNHSGLHGDLNDAVEAMQAVMGTTAGTAILKNFTAGNFAAKQNNETFGTPTINGGTLNTPAIVLGSDATGDMYYRSSGGTVARLPIGTANQILTTDGTTPSWGTASSSNKILQVQSIYSGSVTTNTTSTFNPVTQGTVSMVTSANSRAIVNITCNVSNAAAATNRVGLFLNIDSTDTYDTYVASGKADPNGNGNNAALVYRTAALSAGTHTFVLKMNSSDAGTSVVGNHSIVVMEESA